MLGVMPPRRSAAAAAIVAGRIISAMAPHAAIVSCGIICTVTPSAPVVAGGIIGSVTSDEDDLVVGNQRAGGRSMGETAAQGGHRHEARRHQGEKPYLGHVELLLLYREFARWLGLGALLVS